MPFPEKVRRWALEVTRGKCITPIYDEQHGWHLCGAIATDVDHLEPESVVLYEGGDPNNDATPIPRCKKHHTGSGMTQDDEHGETYLAPWSDENWSRHPDMGAALDEYRKGDLDEFRSAAKKHIELYEAGVRFWNEDEGSERYEKELFDRMAQEYGVPRPDVKPHKLAGKRKKKGWFEGLWE